MKQKAVIRLQLHDHKDRKKAMKTAVGLSGVISASLGGNDKDEITVVGEGIDSVVLTMSLRKMMGFAELLTVGPAEEKEEKKKDKQAAAVSDAVLPYHSVPQPYVYQVQEASTDPCCIM